MDFGEVTCDDDRCMEVAQVSPHGKIRRWCLEILLSDAFLL